MGNRRRSIYALPGVKERAPWRLGLEGRARARVGPAKQRRVSQDILAEWDDLPSPEPEGGV